MKILAVDYGDARTGLAACDRTIRIPMDPRCESLNAASAASVLLWEAARGEI